MNKTFWLAILSLMLLVAVILISDPSHNRTVNDDYDLLLGDGSRADMINGKLERPIMIDGLDNPKEDK
jgi:hypothetical protein